MNPVDHNLYPDIGLFIGLASPLLVAIGGLISMRNQTAGPAYEPETGSARMGTEV